MLIVDYYKSMRPEFDIQLSNNPPPQSVENTSLSYSTTTQVSFFESYTKILDLNYTC